MNITDEMVEAATRAIHDMDCDTPECTEQWTIEGRYGRWARVAVEAVAPLIAAQALRPDPERVAEIAAALEEEDRRRPLVDFWHEIQGSDCWVRPDWAAIVSAVAGHLGSAL